MTCSSHFSHRSRARAAFTLVEILIVVMLTGMVTTLALAPVIMTVRSVVDIQDEWSDTEAMSRALVFIGRDAAAALRLPNVAMIITHYERQGGGDEDTLIIMTTAPTRQMLSAGSVVYKLVTSGTGSVLGSGSVIPGLYRWVLEGVMPAEVKVNNLTVDGLGGGVKAADSATARQSQAKGQLVLPWVSEFSVAIPQLNREKKDWTRNYTGELPTGLFFALTRKGETREKIFVFP